MRLHFGRFGVVLAILIMIGISIPSNILVTASGDWHQVTHSDWDNSEISAEKNCHCDSDPIQKYMVIDDYSEWTQSTYDEFATYSENLNVTIDANDHLGPNMASTRLSVDVETTYQVNYTPDNESILFDNPDSHTMYAVSQTFKPTSPGTCCGVSLMVYREGNPHYHMGGYQYSASLRISMYQAWWTDGATKGKPNENEGLISVTVPAADIGDSPGQWRYFRLIDFFGVGQIVNFTEGQNQYAYCIVVSSNADGDINDSFRYQFKTSHDDSGSIGWYQKYQQLGQSWIKTWAKQDPEYDYPFILIVQNFKSPGHLISKVFDTTEISDVLSNSFSILAQVIDPIDAYETIFLRSGNTTTPDLSWGEWNEVTAPEGRYVQYNISMWSAGPRKTTPHYKNLILNYTPEGGWFQSVELPSEVPVLSVSIDGNFQLNEGMILLYVRNDPENDWHQIDFGDEYDFIEQGNSLAYKIELIRGDNAPESPIVISLTIDYET